MGRIFDMPSDEELLEYENQHSLSNSNVIFNDMNTNTDTNTNSSGNNNNNDNDNDNNNNNNNNNSMSDNTADTNTNGRRRRRVVEEVDGDGVIGQLPELEPCD